MTGAISFAIGFLSIFGCNSVRGQDYFEFMRNEGGRGHSRQRSPPAPKINNVTVSRSSKLAVFGNAAYTDDDFYGSNVGKSPQVVECKGRTKDIYAMGYKAMCNPKLTLVKLNPDPGYEYSPSIILLKRCKGPCGHSTQSCMLLESTFKTIYVKRKEKANGLYMKASKCLEIEVEEHTKCKCGCALMASDCNRRQKYYPEACDCKCENLNDKAKCDSQENMDWDPQTCRCICKMEEEICNTGLHWVPSMCKCAQVMENYIASFQ
ncbi:vascular endothelial growth factor A [Diachasma alloeum]|uniref:vascular endothelial growth factor A n=1 Tax=Diachasma alloeum TaxID=454923 RepID=UPI000738151F|nr:vascular endothelial growth factor A [Diachasma alloeum]